MVACSLFVYINVLTIRVVLVGLGFALLEAVVSEVLEDQAELPLGQAVAYPLEAHQAAYLPGPSEDHPLELLELVPFPGSLELLVVHLG